MGFSKATKKKAKLRLALCGPTGAGKTYSALAVASGLGQKVALIDTECGSASLYADKFAFDVLELGSGHPERYIEAITEAEEAGYDVLIIDSLSHAWMGKDGALELVDKAVKRSKSGNSFTAWRDITPLHNRLVDKLINCKCHLIATMRSKMAYEIQADDRGKKKPTKLGMAPVQRDGMEYEFTMVADLDLSNTMIVSKTRCSEFAQAVIPKPGAKFGGKLLAWLNDGAEGTIVPPIVHEVAPVEAPQPAPKAASEPSAREKMLKRFDELLFELGEEKYAALVGCSVEDVGSWRPKTKGEATSKMALLEKELTQLGAA